MALRKDTLGLSSVMSVGDTYYFIRDLGQLTTDVLMIVHTHFELPRADLRRYMCHLVARGHQTVVGLSSICSNPIRVY